MYASHNLLMSLKNKFLLIAFILIGIGSLFIYSSSATISLNIYGSTLFFVKKNLIGIIIGIVMFCIASNLSAQFIKKYNFVWWAIAIFFTALTIHSPYSLCINGSRRWLRIGAITFQPTELLKITFVICLSTYFSYIKKKYTAYNLIPFIIYCIINSLLLLQQPDFGLTCTFLALALIYFFIIYPYFYYTIALILCIITAAIHLITTRTYRMQRIITFLNPWNDPQGKGFQIIQSFIAIGSGGIFGLGFTQSKQKFFYLPMQHTDFIFSIISEEIGFIGSFLIIILFALLLYYGIRISMLLEDRFSALCTVGFTFLTTIQAGINIAVATGTIPTKGIGLPFISYGNSNLTTMFFMLGIINSLAKNNIKYIQRNI